MLHKKFKITKKYDSFPPNIITFYLTIPPKDKLIKIKIFTKEI